MGLAGQVRTKDSKRVFVVFKKHALLRLVRWLFQLFGNTHDHKSTRQFPSSGLVNAAVILDGFALKWSIPSVGIEDRSAPPVGNDKFKSGFNRCLYGFPRHELTIGSQQDILDAAGKVLVEAFDKLGGFFTVNGCAFTKFAQQIFSGFFDKAQDRTKSFFAAMLCIVAFTGTLLVAINGFHGGIDVDANLIKLKSAQLPDALSKDAHDG